MQKIIAKDDLVFLAAAQAATAKLSVNTDANTVKERLIHWYNMFNTICEELPANTSPPLGGMWGDENQR